jgi:hypothetical protein
VVRLRGFRNSQATVTASRNHPFNAKLDILSPELVNANDGDRISNVHFNNR